MPHFRLIRIYHPIDPFAQREVHEEEFTCDTADPYAVITKGISSINRLYDIHKEQIQTQVAPDASFPLQFKIVFSTVPTTFWYKIERLPDRTETPITDENIIKWAEKQVELEPTIDTGGNWDDTRKEVVRTTIPNTVEKELTKVLLRNDREMLCGDDEEELRDALLHVYTVGVKGYESMTRQELLNQINKEIVDFSEAEYLEDIDVFNADE